MKKKMEKEKIFSGPRGAATGRWRLLMMLILMVGMGTTRAGADTFTVALGKTANTYHVSSYSLYSISKGYDTSICDASISADAHSLVIKGKAPGETGVQVSVGGAGVSYLANVTIQITLDLSTATIELSPDTYTYTGSAVTPTAVVANGITLDSKYYEMSCTDNTASGTATAHITPASAYSAYVTGSRDVNFSIVGSSIVINYDANGGTCDNESVTISQGASITTLPTPIREGYDFDGWFTAAEGGTQVTTSTVFNEATTIYAHWTIKTYTLTFDANGGTGEMSSITFTHGISQTLPNNIFTKTDDTFLWWQGSNGARYSDGQSITLTSDLTLTAQWESAYPFVYTNTSGTANYYNWLGGAFEAAENSGGTIKLYADGTFSRSSGSNYNANAAITLDLNGHTATVDFSIAYNFIAISTFTVTDSGTGTKGTLTFTGNPLIVYIGSLVLQDDVTLAGGVSASTDATVNIENAKVTANIQMWDNAVLNINSDNAIVSGTISKGEESATPTYNITAGYFRNDPSALLTAAYWTRKVTEAGALQNYYQVFSPTIADIPTQHYSGSAVEPALTITLGETPLVAGIDYTVAYTNNIEAGTATATITGTGNYTGTATKEFTIAYTITYNLDGGSVATANPTTYTVETADFTLNNPTREGYTFTGWTGSNGETPQTAVTIAQGSTGNKTYTANWTFIPVQTAYGCITVNQTDATMYEVTIDGNSTDDCTLTSNITASNVTYTRTFTTPYATICLPFAVSDASVVSAAGTFYKFSSVNAEKQVVMEPVTTLQANTPYIVAPASTSTPVTFTYDAATITFPLTATAETTDEVNGKWAFKGAWKRKVFETIADGTAIYFFAAVAKDEISVSPGDFVKVKASSTTKALPFRAYIEYTDGNLSGVTPSAAPARGRKAAETLPERMPVVIASANGTTTEIGSIDTRTGELTIDEWYSLDGRKLDGKPAKKGLYIKNGNKVVIK